MLDFIKGLGLSQISGCPVSWDTLYNLLKMDLGVLKGQTREDYFFYSIFDPSVNQCTVQSCENADGALWPVRRVR